MAKVIFDENKMIDLMDNKQSKNDDEKDNGMTETVENKLNGVLKFEVDESDWNMDVGEVIRPEPLTTDYENGRTSKETISIMRNVVHSPAIFQREVVPWGTPKKVKFWASKLAGYQVGSPMLTSETKPLISGIYEEMETKDLSKGQTELYGHYAVTFADGEYNSNNGGHRLEVSMPFYDDEISMPVGVDALLKDWDRQWFFDGEVFLFDDKKISEWPKSIRDAFYGSTDLMPMIVTNSSSMKDQFGITMASNTSVKMERERLEFSISYNGYRLRLTQMGMGDFGGTKNYPNTVALKKKRYDKFFSPKSSRSTHASIMSNNVGFETFLGSIAVNTFGDEISTKLPNPRQFRNIKKELGAGAYDSGHGILLTTYGFDLTDSQWKWIYDVASGWYLSMNTRQKTTQNNNSTKHTLTNAQWWKIPLISSNLYELQKFADTPYVVVDFHAFFVDNWPIEIERMKENLYEKYLEEDLGRWVDKRKTTKVSETDIEQGKDRKLDGHSIENRNSYGYKTRFISNQEPDRNFVKARIMDDIIERIPVYLERGIIKQKFVESKGDTRQTLWIEQDGICADSGEIIDRSDIHTQKYEVRFDVDSNSERLVNKV